MSLRTAKMLQLIAVVIDRDADAATKELLRQGVLHLVSVREVERSWQDKVRQMEPQVSLARIGEMRKRIESLLEMSEQRRPVSRELDLDRLKPVDLDEVERSLDRIADEVHSFREKQRALQQEILRLEDIRRQLALFGDLPSAVRSGSAHSFLDIRAGLVDADREEALRTALRPLPSVLIVLEPPEPDEPSTGAGGTGREGGPAGAEARRTAERTLGAGAEGRRTCLLVSLRRDLQEIGRILDRHGWEDAELSRETLGPHDQVLRNVNEKAADLRGEQKALGSKVDELISSRRPELERRWADLRMNELFYKAQSSFSRTARTVIISGWLPASKRSSLESGLKRATEGRCYLQWHEPEEDAEGGESRVPVVFSAPRFLAPFQMLVTNYSIPEYGTVDPTPFVAVAYLIMFGLMFGDAGHGLVLMLVGLLGAAGFRSRRAGGTGGGEGVGSSRTLRLMQLIAWCGGSAVVFGVLFGSYFGMGWFRPLWFDYHGVVMGHGAAGGMVGDIYDVLVITIYFGVAVIAVGLILNWINLVSKRRWKSLLLEKGGIIGGWIYGAGVWAAIGYVRSGYSRLPDPDRLFWLIGLPALLLLAKPVLELFGHRGPAAVGGAGETGGPAVDGGAGAAGETSGGAGETRGAGAAAGGGLAMRVMNAGMEWIVELLEIFSGYMANTLSFMRVAGLGIAHVSLMTAFFAMARMAATPRGYTVWSILILVLGNALVIVLEGLSAGIQSLRLNYYEFFSKYFRGNGRAYMPISLKSG